jgi:methyl-accepting chemotaxis protein
VKNLALMTSASTGEIDETVATIQRDLRAVAEVVTGIADAVGAIDAITAEIASATTGQRATVDRLSQQLDQAMDRIRDLATEPAGNC